MSALENYLKDLIQKEIIPGISLAVADDERILYELNLGFRSRYPKKELLEKGTVYDLASLTKPLITAILVLKLFELDNLSLNSKISLFIPQINPEIEVIDLLTHTSGLPAWYPLYLKDQDYLKTINELKLAGKPKKKVNYSCLGYILLFYLVQKISTTDFRELAEELLFNPLNLNNSFLGEVRPGKGTSGPAIAPTEGGNVYEKKKCLKIDLKLTEKVSWRTSLICGETHDGNSFYRGGVAGNAGLFSNLDDLQQISREIYAESATILKPETTDLFWTNFTKTKKSSRTAGFKMNQSFYGSGGRGLEKRAIGHNGFTGTSIWLEPKSRLRYIILTNRVHPEVREDINFNAIRRKIHRYIKNSPQVKDTMKKSHNER